MSEGRPPEPPGKGSKGSLTRVDGQRASLAQLLLVTRLRARNRRDLAVDSLERAAHVIWVTCKNWFVPSREPVREDLPADTGRLASRPPDNDNNDFHKGPDAHRHD